jgi:hypothetical protein
MRHQIDYVFYSANSLDDSNDGDVSIKGKDCLMSGSLNSDDILNLRSQWQ